MSCHNGISWNKKTNQEWRESKMCWKARLFKSTCFMYKILNWTLENEKVLRKTEPKRIVVLRTIKKTIDGILGENNEERNLGEYDTHWTLWKQETLMESVSNSPSEPLKINGMGQYKNYKGWEVLKSHDYLYTEGYNAKKETETDSICYGCD